MTLEIRGLAGRLLWTTDVESMEIETFVKSGEEYLVARGAKGEMRACVKTRLVEVAYLD